MKYTADLHPDSLHTFLLPETMEKTRVLRVNVTSTLKLAKLVTEFVSHSVLNNKLRADCKPIHVTLHDTNCFHVAGRNCQTFLGPLRGGTGLNNSFSFSGWIRKIIYDITFFQTEYIM